MTVTAQGNTVVVGDMEFVVDDQIKVLRLTGFPVVTTHAIHKTAGMLWENDKPQTIFAVDRATWYGVYEDLVPPSRFESTSIGYQNVLIGGMPVVIMKSGPSATDDTELMLDLWAVGKQNIVYALDRTAKRVVARIVYTS